MIVEKDKERIKDLLNTGDIIDFKIGIGLAVEKGMAIEELAKKCLHEQWIIELLPSGTPPDFKDKYEKEILEGLVSKFNEILN